MDFSAVVKQIEQFIFELLMWVIFYPYTLVRVVFRPTRMLGYVSREIVADPDTAFASAIRPPLFLFLCIAVGSVIAPIGAIFATVSGVVGGILADRLAKKRGLHWQSWMVGILKTIALPFSLTFYFLHDANIAIAAYFLALLFASSYLGPTFALLQGLAPMRLRALWAAITLLVINLIGLGLGPTLVGRISDMLRPTYGEESLRWAMFVFAVATPWAIFHYWRAGVILKQRGQVTAGA